MNVIATIMGPDRPGLVETIAETVSNHGGNWTESRMAHLAGQFAGMVQIEIAADAAPQLERELTALSEKGLSVSVVTDESASADSSVLKHLTLNLVGQDRAGIVSQVSRVIASHGLNVESLETERESAPMSGEMHFKANAVLSGPPEIDPDALRNSLEEIAQDLMVEISLGE